MLDAGLVEIVGRLVKQKQVRVLYERLREQEARLLAAGKGSYLFFERRVQIDRLKHLFYLRVYGVDFFGKYALKKLAYRQLHFTRGDNLAAGRDGQAVRKVYKTVVRLEGAGYEAEDGRLPRPVLAHEGNLSAPADRKIHRLENGLFDSPVKRDLLKPHDNLSALHRDSLPRSLQFPKLVSIKNALRRPRPRLLFCG